MKLRTTVIFTIFLALILSVSPMGYCNANTMDIFAQNTTDDAPVYESTNTTDTVAQKTTNNVSEYESTTQIGIGTGIPIAIVTGTAIDGAATVVVGDGALLGAGTYYVHCAQFENEERALASVDEAIRTLTTADVEIQTESKTGISPVRFCGDDGLEIIDYPERPWLYRDITGVGSEVMDADEIVEGIVLGEEVSFASVAAPYIMAAGLVILAVIVVVLVTGTVVYLCWSAS